MATLVLTTIGTAVGGPLGGALGALLGQSIDARLFAPKGRHGPRLDDLRVQTSSYGSAIPRIYGRMRVSGTVIWATDLVEHRNRQSNGKGRGSTTTYSYSLSMAVALSSRPLLRVGRIWAEGNLLRGADGAFKSPVTFRLHHGDEDQPVDPLIAAAEGGEAPAYRGIAYALFEDFDLSPFGNRVPLLTFEVEADDGAVLLTQPLGDLLGDAMAVEPGIALAGCALAAESREAAIAGFAPLMPVGRIPGEAGWRMGEDGAQAPAVLGEAVRGQREEMLGGDASVPQQIILSTYDPARDFQIGTQSARVAGGSAPAERLALPLALDAATSKALAGELALRARTTRQSMQWPQGFAALGLPPSHRVQLPGASAVSRVVERRIEGAAVTLTLSEERVAIGGTVMADSGRALTSPDLATGMTRAALFDLPAIRTGDMADGRLVLAAAGGPGWRGARVRARASAGAPLVDLGTIGQAAMLGTVEATSPALSPGSIDLRGEIIVQVPGDGAQLVDASDADLIAGANLAMAGEEIIQFGKAEPLGAGRWRLTRLLRGRLGTGDAAGQQTGGEGFAMLDDAALMGVALQIGLAPLAIGGEIWVEGVADTAPLILAVDTFGRARRPLAPVHLRCEWQQDGGLLLRWTRRSRSGADWVDGIDAPLDAREERYRVTLGAGSDTDVREPGQSSLLLPPAEVIAWRAVGGPLPYAIAQMGDVSVSLPLSGSIELH